jgi:hypothetical protein
LARTEQSDGVLPVTRGIARGAETLASIAADVCVVGSGPVGLAVAVGLARAGRSVVLLESGLEKPSQEASELSAAEFIAPDRHADMALAVSRAFGGTSWLWGGRCVPLDRIDFSARPHVPCSGWPISYEDVARHHDEAADFLGCGSADFEFPWPPDAAHPASVSSLRLDTVERWCCEPVVTLRNSWEHLPPNLQVVLDATLVDLEFSPAGDAVEALSVASRHCGRQRFGRFRHVVLACGGVETARLLLVAQRKMPRLFGGLDGPLGRTYMGHLSGRISRIEFTDPARARDFAYIDRHDNVLRRRISLDERSQVEHELPNVIFYPDNPMMGDPGHGNAVLSALYLGLSMPVVGRHFVSEAIRRMQLAEKPRYAGHIRNLVLGGPGAITAISRLLWQKLALGRRKPFLFAYAKDGIYPFHYHAEQVPNTESRVRLGETCDALGMPRLTIDLRFSEADGRGVARAHLLVDKAVREMGLARLRFDVPDADLAEAVLANARDGFHQIGLTRMGASSRESVVDANCKVHGLLNLFVAGSSVFPTAGQANPTFASTALAFRLAHHVAMSLRPLETGSTAV